MRMSECVRPHTVETHMQTKSRKSHIQRILDPHANRTRARYDSTLQIMMHIGSTIDILQNKTKNSNDNLRKANSYKTKELHQRAIASSDTHFKLNEADCVSFLPQYLHLLKTRLSMVIQNKAQEMN